MFMTIHPIIASNNINKEINNHIDKFVYNIFPIDTISELSNKLLSQLLDETYTLSFNKLNLIKLIKLFLLGEYKESRYLSILGFRLYIYNNTPIIIDKNKLFFVSVCNSDILIFINIKINKNNIETAPIYTYK